MSSIIIASRRNCNFPDFTHPAEGPDPCELAKKPRYRKGPSECFDNNEHVSCCHQTWTASCDEQFELHTFVAKGALCRVSCVILPCC